MSIDLNQKVGQFFWLYEFVRSSTADRLGIDNATFLKPAHVARIARLCEQVLDPLRAKVGPIIITSGFRCHELNDAIGSSRDSQHVDAEAADIESPVHSPADLFKTIMNGRDMRFDQLILEFPPHGWTHVSTVQNRGECLVAEKRDGKTIYRPWKGE